MQSANLTFANAHVAADARGNAVAVWDQCVPGTGVPQPNCWEVFSSSTLSDGGWTNAERIDVDLGTTHGAINGGAAVSVSANGDALATWYVHAADGGTTAWFARRPLGGQWKAPQPFSIPEDAGAPAGRDLLVVHAADSAGRAQAVLARQTPGNAVAYWAVTLEGDGRVSSGQRVLPGSVLFHSVVEVSVTPSGAVGFAAVIDENDQVQVARFDRSRAPGHQWGSEVAVGTAVAPGVSSFGGHPHLALALAPSGEAVLAWERREPGSQNTSLWAARADVAGAWSEPEPLSPSGASEGHPSIGVDATGRALVTFRRVVPDGTEVWALRGFPDGGWAAPVLVADDVPGQNSGSHTPVRVRSDGTGLVSFARGMAPDVAAFSSRFDPLRGFTTPERLDAPSAGVSSFDDQYGRGFANADVAVHDDGATVVWIRGNTVWGARLR